MYGMMRIYWVVILKQDVLVLHQNKPEKQTTKLSGYCRIYLHQLNLLQKLT